MRDSSTIGLTIGLDVLEALVELATTNGIIVSDREKILITIAQNAVTEARENADSIPYETEGMSECRRLLKDKGIPNHRFDTFKDCLTLLETHGFKLMRDIDNHGTFAGVRTQPETNHAHA